MAGSRRVATLPPELPGSPWAAHAGQWARLGSPLRPCPEDLERLEQAWRAALPSGVPSREINVLLLGMTPELARHPWAEKTSLVAVDASAEMIRAVWPGDTPQRRAVLGRWERLPFADASFDLIVSDDGLAMLPEPASLVAVASELRRLLRPGGRVAMRLFTPVATPETEQAVVAALRAGELRNFHGLKLRLLLALDAQTNGRGVRVGDAWDCFQRLFPDRAALARQLHCDLATVETIDTYRGLGTRYRFRTLEEVALVFSGFRMSAGPRGRYPLAEYCPVFSLAPLPCTHPGSPA